MNRLRECRQGRVGSRTAGALREIEAGKYVPRRLLGIPRSLDQGSPGNIFWRGGTCGSPDQGAK